MHISYDPDANIDWSTVFAEQALQTGNGVGFRGFAYQRGSGGVGGLISKLISFILPLAQQVGRSVGTEALLASSRIADDLTQGKPLGESLRLRGRESYKTLAERAAHKLQQGSGRERRGNPKKKVEKNAKTGKAKRTRNKKKAVKRTLKDILGSWEES